MNDNDNDLVWKYDNDLRNINMEVTFMYWCVLVSLFDSVMHGSDTMIVTYGL